MSPPTRPHHWLFLLAMVLLSGCGALPRTSGDAYSRLLVEAGRASDERHHRRALVAYGAAAELRPDRAEPYLGQAEAYFAMGDYAAALVAAKAALQRDGGNLDARSVAWASRLEGAPDRPAARAEVRRELEAALAAADPPAEHLFLIYKGYRYLHDLPMRGRLILRLAALPLSEPLKGAVSASLFAEILERRSGDKQVPHLSLAYLRYFPHGPQAGAATRSYLGHLERKGREPARVWAQRQLDDDRTDDRAIQGIAEWAIGRGVPLVGATARLLRSAQGWRAPEDARDDPFSPLAWGNSANYWRYLAAVMALVNGDDAQGRELLERLLEDGVVSGEVHLALGRLAYERGESESARRHLVSAAQSTHGYDGAADTLLGRILGPGRDPRSLYRSPAEPWFRDVTVEVGLDGVAASRVAWGDMDGDGLPDLMLDGCRLWMNGGVVGFMDQTEAWGLGGVRDRTGGILVDLDNDGRLDLVTTARAGLGVWLQRGGRLVDRSAHWLGAAATRYAEALAAGDWNNDGWADIYVARYERPAVTRAVCARDLLLINREGRGFRPESALNERVDEPLCGRGVTWSDLDGDGRQEIVVANYRLDPNLLWQREASGRPAETAGEAGVRGRQKAGYFGHSIGPVAGDLNGDGDTDLLITNLAHPRSLRYSDLTMVLHQEGPMRFVDRMVTSGLRYDETNADPVLADFDNDGDLDLFVTSIYRGRMSRFYLNDGGGRFADRSWVADARVANGWGAAAADYDRDGDLDLLVASRDGVRLLRNEVAVGRSIRIRLTASACNQSGLGARVVLRGGGLTQVREITAGRGTGSQDEMVAHFGVGFRGGPFELTVRNPCGRRVTVGGLSPGEDLTIRLP